MDGPGLQKCQTLAESLGSQDPCDKTRRGGGREERKKLSFLLDFFVMQSKKN